MTNPTPPSQPAPQPRKITQAHDEPPYTEAGYYLRKRGLYYRPQAAGYTQDQTEAGVFSYAYAFSDVQATSREKDPNDRVTMELARYAINPDQPQPSALAAATPDLPTVESYLQRLAHLSDARLNLIEWSDFVNRVRRCAKTSDNAAAQTAAHEAKVKELETAEREVDRLRDVMKGRSVREQERVDGWVAIANKERVRAEKAELERDAARQEAETLRATDAFNFGILKAAHEKLEMTNEQSYSLIPSEIEEWICSHNRFKHDNVTLRAELTALRNALKEKNNKIAKFIHDEGDIDRPPTHEDKKLEPVLGYAKASINDLLIRLSKTENVSVDETWSQRNNRNDSARAYAQTTLACIENAILPNHET